MKFDAVQIPAVIGGVLLFLEGRSNMRPHHATALRALPAFAAAIGVYIAWNDNFYATACVYVLAGLSTFFAHNREREYWNYASRLLLNFAPAILFFLSLFVPRVEEEISNWVSFVGFDPSTWSSFTVRAALASVFVVISAVALWRYMRGKNVESSTRSDNAESQQSDASSKETEREKYVLFMEKLRIEKGFKAGWLYYHCRDRGMLEVLEDLIRKGQIQRSWTKSEDRSQSGSEQDIGPYEILGIKPGATQEEIRAAYLEQIKLYHPDKVASLGPELQKVALKMSQAITNAFEQLKSQQ